MLGLSVTSTPLEKRKTALPFLPVVRMKFSSTLLPTNDSSRVSSKSLVEREGFHFALDGSQNDRGRHLGRCGMRQTNGQQAKKLESQTKPEKRKFATHTRERKRFRYEILATRASVKGEKLQQIKPEFALRASGLFENLDSTRPNRRIRKIRFKEFPCTVRGIKARRIRRNRPDVCVPSIHRHRGHR